VIFAGLVVIAANAGGAWSPIGDVSTTMLWIGPPDHYDQYNCENNSSITGLFYSSGFYYQYANERFN
jgi:hypothetical protein